MCEPSHCLHIDVRRLLTVDVNGVLTQLSLTEVQLDSMDGLAASLDTTVEEVNPDCFILVYAVDDKDSFGELRRTKWWGLSIDLTFCISFDPRHAGLSGWQRAAGGQEVHRGGRQVWPGPDPGGQSGGGLQPRHGPGGEVYWDQCRGGLQHWHSPGGHRAPVQVRDFFLSF